MGWNVKHGLLAEVWHYALSGSARKQNCRALMRSSGQTGGHFHAAVLKLGEVGRTGHSRCEPLSLTSPKVTEWITLYTTPNVKSSDVQNKKQGETLKLSISSVSRPLTSVLNYSQRLRLRMRLGLRDMDQKIIYFQAQSLSFLWGGLNVYLQTVVKIKCRDTVRFTVWKYTAANVWI